MGTLAKETGQLEQRVMLEEIPDPEGPGGAVPDQARAGHGPHHGHPEPRDLRPDGDPGRFVPGDSQLQLTDIIDQFERVAGVADARNSSCRASSTSTGPRPRPR